MNFTKEDGARIKITFDRPITSDVTALTPFSKAYKYPDSSYLFASSTSSTTGVSISNMVDGVKEHL